jgi:branched-chain amino acid transport system ATP-binding protein
VDPLEDPVGENQIPVAEVEELVARGAAEIEPALCAMALAAAVADGEETLMLLESKNVTHSFGGLMAVSDANICVERGEIVGLIGPNGAGKTTLFNIVSGAIKPTQGSVIFKGEDITGLPPHQICRKGLARTFQTVKLFANMTAFENVRLALLFGNPERKIDRKQAEREVNQLLATMGLLSERNKSVKDLSLATQKRLEIARALATKPDLLLLDEVMAGLTPKELSQSIQFISQLRQRGITIFMIEHVMHAILEMCDRVMVFHFGSKIMEGTPHEVVHDPTVSAVYLGK